MAQTCFSTTLQALRKKQHVTQEQLANYLGVSAQAVSKWENGSYPEGDLLPKISEFFGVSISYLYGQEKEEVSTEQRVLNDLIEISTGDKADDVRYREYFDKVLDIAWAFQNGAWRNNKTYYSRGIPEDEVRTASILSCNAGFSFFNLNRNRQFVLISSEPKEGYAKNLEINEEVRRFLALLGKPGALEVICFMLTLKGGEFVAADTIAKQVGLSIERTKELLKEAGSFQTHANAPFVCVDIIRTEDKEVAYGINTAAVGMYIGLLLIVDQLLHPPYGYQMQINSREKSFLNREDVIEALKKKKGKGES